jgi:hypothetical protein
MILAVDNHAKIWSVMPESEPPAYIGRQTIDNLDLTLRSRLDALRKPLKLTATLKRRALRDKTRGKQHLPGPSR